VPSCPATSNAVIVTPKTSPTAAFTQTNVSCIGGADGTITVTAANGIAPYQYSIDNGSTFQASNYFTGLTDAGVYKIVVMDAKSCKTTAIPADITEPSPIAATISVTTGLSCGTGNATQQATVTVIATPGTGTPPYQYSFDGTNYSSISTFTTNVAGPVSAWVKDANGCIIAAPVSTTVVPLDPPTDLAFSGTAVYCNPVARQTSTVTLTTTKGSGTLSYVILSPASAVGNVSGASSGIFTLLTPDTYTFQVTDANGCTYQESYTVDPVTNITVAGQLISDVTCFGTANGIAQFDVTNFKGTYTASINPVVPFVLSGGIVTASNLAPGNYTITVSDAITGCSNTASVLVSQPVAALNFTATATNINCTNDNATITVVATGGTLSYSYSAVPAGSRAPTTFSSDNQLVVDTNNGTVMVWDVYVKDANSCMFNKLKTILLDSNPTIARAVATQCPSSTATYDITVTATGFSAGLSYSVDGVSYQNSSIITVNAPGNYNVTVKDANGCISAPAAVNILAPITLDATITALPSCTVNNGSITASATGGSGNYSYQLGAVTRTTTPAVFNNLASGNHTIVVTDLSTNCTNTVTRNLAPATPITGFAATPTPVSCKGGSDGTITATLATPVAGVNDNPVYKYSLNGGTPQDSPFFGGLTAGTYTVAVTSERGCIDTKTVQVTEPALIVVNAVNIKQFACTTGTNGANYATITVDPANVVGGSRNYLVYEFFKAGVSVQKGTSNTYTEANFVGGSYSVNVYDDKGCMGTYASPIIINPYVRLDKMNVVATAITCNNPERITVTAVDASGTAMTGINYGLVDVSGALTFVNNTTGIFAGLKVGNYIITATNSATGCSIQKAYYVNEPNTFLLNAVKTSDVICYGSNEGAVTINLIDKLPTPTDESGPFSYTVVGPVPSSGSLLTAGPLNLTGLTAGQYTVSATLTNSPFCTVTTSFTISQPASKLKISETHTEITCVPGNDGTISARATGGWDTGYEYQLERNAAVVSAWSAISDFTDLSAGSYKVSVRDANGCIEFATIVLNNPTPMTITVSPNVVLSCNGDASGSITANAAGGQGSNYMYTLNITSETPIISSGPQALNVFTGLKVGTYTVTATDAWGCSATSGTITISEPTRVEASLTALPVVTCDNMTTLTLTAAGGTAPYRYSATQNFASSIAMSGNSVTIPVGVGTYHYYVYDANGCVGFVSNDIKIDALEPLTVPVDVQNAVINCKGDKTGVIVATAKGAFGNYIYTLTDAAGVAISPAPIQVTPGRFTDLAVGTYMVRVDSGDCSKNSVAVTIIEPQNAITAQATPIPVTCNGNNDGQIAIVASGGTGIIKYAISPNMNQFFVGNTTGGHTFKNLKPGSYAIIVQDEKGCFVLDLSVTVTEPPAILTDYVRSSMVQEFCAGDNNAAFDIYISGGVAPYSTSIDGGAFVPVTNPSKVSFTGLTGGDHTVIVKDTNTCEMELLVPLDKSVVLDPKVNLTYDCVNDLPANKVTVTIDPSNKPADVVYSLDGSPTQTSNVFENVVPGVVHVVDVYHNNGCTKASADFILTKIDPLNLSLDLGKLNEIVATATGGSGVYRFTINGEDMGSNNKYIYFKSGNYEVRVTDSNGCSVSLTTHFDFIDIVIPPIFTPTGDGHNDTWKPTNTENYPDIKFVVYDRYGREVGTFGSGESWDGKYKGTELPMGDYWYVLKLRHSQDDREFIGHFTLYR
jgi:gliding motility-associated-like protein